MVTQMGTADGCIALKCKFCDCNCATQGCECTPKDCSECFSCCDICFSFTCNKRSPKTDYECLMKGTREGECFKMD